MNIFISLVLLSQKIRIINGGILVEMMQFILFYLILFFTDFNCKITQTRVNSNQIIKLNI